MCYGYQKVICTCNKRNLGHWIQNTVINRELVNPNKRQKKNNFYAMTITGNLEYKHRDTVSRSRKSTMLVEILVFHSSIESSVQLHHSTLASWPLFVAVKISGCDYECNHKKCNYVHSVIRYWNKYFITFDLRRTWSVYLSIDCLIVIGSYQSLDILHNVLRCHVCSKLSSNT